MNKGILRRKLEEVVKANRHRFHVPGHKGRMSWPVPGTLDLTELPGLDNLHNPTGVLAASQSRIAGIYQATNTFFLVNGSSVGIMAAMVSLLAPGERVLVERTCHKAVISGLVHSGAVPVFVEQEFCRHRLAWLPPTVQSVKKKLAAQRIKAAIFTNPCYFGLVPDIVSISRVCRDYGVALIVDEAHGAHLRFGRDAGMPPSGIEAAADIIVQSPHKTLGAMTQAAWAHVLDPDVAEEFQRNLNLFHTTSPSYLLLASLEQAALDAEARGAQWFQRLAVANKLLRNRCLQLGVDLWDCQGTDWTKVVFKGRLGAERLLRQKGIYHEITLNGNILFVLTMSDALCLRSLEFLLNQLPSFAKLPPVIRRLPVLPPLPIMEYTPAEVWKKKGERVNISNAQGRIARQTIAPYPPGALVMVPGQKISGELEEYLVWLYNRRVIPGWIEVL